ncbi:MAG: class I SAM-dependent methyltransferase [Rubricoccaceae bacterium]
MSLLATMRLLAQRYLPTSVLPPSHAYWEARYATGGTSGPGSYGDLARWKAETLNALVAQERVESVVEFGCGDGAQLALADYPRYLGLDISPTVVARCRTRFAGDPTRQFEVYAPGAESPPVPVADLALSLDVIYHLIEDDVFERYMRDLFASARRLVAIYSSNDERADPAPHVRHRIFTTWVATHAPAWRLYAHVRNPHAGRTDLGRAAPLDFCIYERGV